MKHPARGWTTVLAFCLLFGSSACSRSAQSHLDRGTVLLDEGRLPDAVLELRNAVQKDPMLAEARLALGEAYLAQGDRTRALPELVRAADLLPRSVEAQVRVGELLLMAGRFEEAGSRADKALEEDASSVPAQVLRANAMAGLKDFDGAVREIEQAIALDPQQASTYANLGALQALRGNTAEAEAAFRVAIETDPDSREAHLALGNFFWASGRQGEAEAAFRSAHAIDPTDILPNRVLGAFYVASGRTAEAEPYLLAVANRSAIAGPRIALADYYARNNRAAEAEAALEVAAGQLDGFAPARSRLALLRFDARRKDEAYEIIDDVLSKVPNDIRALLTKSRFLAADGQFDTALSLAQQAVAADSQSADAFYQAGLLHAQLNEVDQAVAAFREVLRLNPRASVASVLLGQLELSRGGAPTALATVRQAATQRPDDPVVRLVTARAQMASGDLGAAETTMRQLIGEFPNAATVRAQWGLLHLRKGDVQSARLAFSMALALNPGSFEAVSGLVAADMVEGKLGDAAARVEARLESLPADTRTLMLGGTVHTVARDFAKAEQLLRRALEADATQTHAYRLLAQIYVAQNRLDEARAEFEAVAVRRPSDVAASTMVAMILEAQGLTAEAQQRYEAIVARDPRAAVASNNLAWMYASRGERLDLALRLAQAAKAELPDEAQVNDTLGYVYLRRNLGSLAIAPLQLAVTKEPQNPSFRFRLGQAFAQTDDRAAARREIEHALKLAPDFPGAAEARALLATLREN